MVRVAVRDSAGAHVTAARLCAYRTVRRVFDDSAYADRAFAAEADRAGLDSRDRAFAQHLAYGTVQRRDELDYVLGALTDRPLGTLDAPLRDALRMGVHQLLHMDSVPDHAAVEQTVELAKVDRGGGARLANAVMRRASREARDLVGQLTPDTPGDAAVLHSHPEWIVRLWWEVLGPDATLELLAADNRPAETAVRVNEIVASVEEVRAALGEEGVGIRPAPGLPEGLLLDDGYDVARSPLFRRGALTPQSRASMLVGRLLAPQPGEQVLDMCAAPGAKTTHIAAMMRGEGTLVALERHAGRARELEKNLARMRADWVRVVRADATDAGDHGGPFDRVLVDAPCSGLGTLRGRPDSRWRRNPEQVTELARSQSALLDAAAPRVRPGGTLVYSTCTISPEENEQQVERFLARHQDFAPDDLGAELPALRHESDPRSLLLLPHRDGTDGFFISRMTRAAA